MDTDVWIQRVEAVQEHLEAAQGHTGPGNGAQETIAMARENVRGALQGLKAAGEDLRRYSTRRQMVQDVERGFAAGRSLQEVAGSALNRLPRLLSCVRASVATFDLDAGDMLLLAVYAQDETGLETGWRGRINGPLVLSDLYLGKTCEVEDIRSLPPSSPYVRALQTEGVRAFVGVPFVLESGLAGSMNIGLGRPGPPSAADRELVRDLADRLLIGFRRACLFEEARPATPALAGGLAASLIHDVSNPLQTATIYVGLAEESLGRGEDVDDYLQIAAQELRRATEIIAGLRVPGRMPDGASRSSRAWARVGACGDACRR
jgi:GAF domain-containing protein